MCKLPCLFVLVAAALAAAESTPIPLWPGTAPGEKGVLGPERDTTKTTDCLVSHWHTSVPSRRPDFTLLIYPAYLTSKSDQGPQLAAELKVTTNTPPSFLIQAEDDSVGVENTLVYYAALRTARVPAEAHLFPIGGHGYGLRSTQKPITGWPRFAEPWLRSLGVLSK